MKKLFAITLVPLILVLSLHAYSQEIDPSLLKNLSPEQIELAKSQLAKSNSSEKPKPITKESTRKSSQDDDIDDDIDDSINKKYGYNYFSSVPTISAVGDLPLPNDYKISLNDQFTVILLGQEKIFLTLM